MSTVEDFKSVSKTISSALDRDVMLAKHASSVNNNYTFSLKIKLIGVKDFNNYAFVSFSHLQQGTMHRNPLVLPHHRTTMLITILQNLFSSNKPSSFVRWRTTFYPNSLHCVSTWNCWMRQWHLARKKLPPDGSVSLIQVKVFIHHQN